MNFDYLLNVLEFDKGDKEEIKRYSDISLNPDVSRNIKLLTEKNFYESAEKELQTLLSPDEKGIKMLCAMVKAASISYEKYLNAGISEQVFIDTMKCFTRFTNEFKSQKGYFGFDRSFWTGRQLSLCLFRIGELEYETTVTEDGKNVIYMHVPSDCDLSDEKVDFSIISAKAFFKKYYPEYAAAEYRIQTWLLSSSLKLLLPKTSRIIKFQKRFDVCEENPSDGYKFWVFGDSNRKPEDFAENTTLQRGIKRYVLQGNALTEAAGILKGF